MFLYQWLFWKGLFHLTPPCSCQIRTLIDWPHFFGQEVVHEVCHLHLDLILVLLLEVRSSQICQVWRQTTFWLDGMLPLQKKMFLNYNFGYTLLILTWRTLWRSFWEFTAFATGFRLAKNSTHATNNKTVISLRSLERLSWMMFIIDDTYRDKIFLL